MVSTSYLRTMRAVRRRGTASLIESERWLRANNHRLDDDGIAALNAVREVLRERGHVPPPIRYVTRQVGHRDAP